MKPSEHQEAFAAWSLQSAKNWLKQNQKAGLPIQKTWRNQSLDDIKWPITTETIRKDLEALNRASLQISTNKTWINFRHRIRFIAGRIRRYPSAIAWQTTNPEDPFGEYQSAKLSDRSETTKKLDQANRRLRRTALQLERAVQEHQDLSLIHI